MFSNLREDKFMTAKKIKDTITSNISRWIKKLEIEKKITQLMRK